MFETSVIQGQTKVAGARRLSVLTVSIIAHSAVIIGAVGMSIASVDFPKNAPDEFSQGAVFTMPLQIPPPIGTPEGNNKPPTPTPAVTPPPQPQPNQEVAPGVVPDVIPQVATTASTGEGNSTGETSEPGTGPLGQPWGVEGSLGDLNAGPIVGTTPVVEEKIYQAHEVKAPIGIFRPAPPYPESLRRTRMQATVVVRCIIDRNGHVRDPQVIVPASMSPFNDAVVSTVQRWRFTPGSLGGVAVESYLNLTVRFAVN
ncbi:MAG TPA: energy transducer TonB [Thermoanaerobaculia bacterium]|jgi:protein TonB|nr:energy transducer TonB [Thermoanaerobaculia bacterium]